MSEKCPLIGAAWAAEIPNTCYEQCERLWDEAVTTRQNTFLDVLYDTDDTACKHFESENLDCELSERGGAERRYAINDQCTSCGTELTSTWFSFICPFEAK